MDVISVKISFSSVNLGSLQQQFPIADEKFTQPQIKEMISQLSTDRNPITTLNV